MGKNKDKTGDKLTFAEDFILYKRCLSYFKPYTVYVIIASIAMILSGVFNAASAWLVKPALDKIFYEKDPDALLFIPLLFIAVTLAKVSTKLVQNYLMQYCGLGVLETLRDQLYKKIIMLPLRYFESAQVGVLMSRIINDVVSIRASIPATVMSIRQVITMFCLIANAFYMNAELAFWAVVILPLSLFPFIYFTRRVRKLSRKNQAKLADISTLLQEILSGIRVVKAFRTEQKEGERFDKENRNILKLALKQCLAGEFNSAIMELVGAVGIGTVIWFGGVQVLNGQMTAGEFFSFVAALVMLYDPIKKLSSSNGEIQHALAGAERVFELLDDPTLNIEQGGTLELEPQCKEVRFENVNFTYNDTADALSNISFSLREGERVAIVGPSGAGKTTLVNLVPRFYDPTSGKILINGHENSKYSLTSLRKNIAIVSQDNFLFNLSILDNITYGMEGVSKEDAIHAAKAAFAHDFIMEMSEGYETIIGERGVKLSGGQRQRLTIARALVKNAPLLILDEATSALDSHAEKTVQKALDNLMTNRTSIVIAHRLSTIIHSDKILVMQSGKIVGIGSHKELLESCSLYKSLYEMQFNTPDIGKN